MGSVNTSNMTLPIYIIYSYFISEGVEILRCGTAESIRLC